METIGLFIEKANTFPHQLKYPLHERETFDNYDDENEGILHGIKVLKLSIAH